MLRAERLLTVAILWLLRSSVALLNGLMLAVMSNEVLSELI